jgi:hypothetical protein
MGIDVNLYAVGDITDEQITAALPFVKARVDFDQWSSLERSKYEDDGRVELSTGHRYYGPGYERGPWPSIYGEIRVMQAAFPGASVYYGGDSSDYGELCTDDFLAEMWAHFLGPHGDDYRESSRRWNATFEAAPIVRAVVRQVNYERRNALAPVAASLPVGDETGKDH